MEIEQEFFEKFKIPKEKRLCTRGYSNICTRYQHNKNCVDCNDFIKEYPPITPEIVLGLEEIIIKHTFGYINMEGRKIIENAPFGYIYKYSLYECHCGISSSHKIGKGKTRKEALLKLCIQLKDEIQNQVKALFKC